MIEISEIKKLALLARLDVPPGELESLRKDIDAILGSVSEIAQAPVKPTKEGAVFDVENHTPWTAGGLRNVMRADEEFIKKEEYREAILSQVGAREGEYIKVKKIL